MSSLDGYSTFLGVFLPCFQSIFGVIAFLRLSWATGEGGVIDMGIVLVFSCTITICTAMSMSALVNKNNELKCKELCDGPFGIIRNFLGPATAGAVGILYFIGSSLSGCMFIIGAIEILFQYVIGDCIAIFDSFENNVRFYGTILLFLLAAFVSCGMRIVTRLSVVPLLFVSAAVISILTGLIANIDGDERFYVCAVGDRLVKHDVAEETNCQFEALSTFFCKQDNKSRCESCDDFFLNGINRTGWIKAFPGWRSGVFYENLKSNYSGPIQSRYDENENWVPREEHQITTFILLGILFPSMTGILAGSSRVSKLKKATKSIPIGTLTAIGITTLLYFLIMVLFAGTVNRLVLLDKFGESLSGNGIKGMVASYVSWPPKTGPGIPTIAEIGALLATIGGGLQVLTSAPRLLHAVAQQRLLAPLDSLAKMIYGEPLRSLVVTVILIELGILIGSLEDIAPLLSMFFLLSYAFINLAALLLAQFPKRRPSFRMYHWSTSFNGVGLCVFTMFVINFSYALLALLIFLSVFCIVEVALLRNKALTIKV